MQLLVIVLNKVECLEKLLKSFCDNGFTGATVINSHGMAQALADYEEGSFLMSLRSILDPEHKENRTIFMVIKDSQVKNVSDIVNSVTGGLKNPDTGIIFTLPVGYTEGIGDYHD